MEGLYRTDLHTVSILAFIAMCRDNIRHRDFLTEEKKSKFVFLNKIKLLILNLIFFEGKLKLEKVFISLVRKYNYTETLPKITNLIFGVWLVIKAFIG